MKTFKQSPKMDQGCHYCWGGKAMKKAEGGKVKAFWETKNPKKESKKLTSSQKSFAKARAAKAGRPYPNLVDNSAASRRGK
jgi:hypothetical protein